VYQDSSHDDDDTGTTTTTNTVVTTPGPPPPPPEVCDGVDNNGDGAIDEGFPDTDLDTVADCLDDACVVDLPGASTVTLVPRTELTAPHGPRLSSSVLGTGYVSSR
jgi:hypothetical protein